MSPRSEPTATITLREFLLGDADAEEVMGTKVQDNVLEEMGKDVGLRTKAEFQVVRRGLGKAVSQLLEVDLVDVLVSSWIQIDKVAAAARTSVTSPEPQSVVLFAHTIRSRHNPSVDVLVDGVKKTSIRFEFSLDFEVEGVVATIQAGRLVAFDVAGCDMKAMIACQGKKILERSGQLLLPRTVKLPGEGILLIRAAEPRAQPELPGSHLHH